MSHVHPIHKPSNPWNAQKLTNLITFRPCNKQKHVCVWECASLLGGLNSEPSGDRSNFIRLNRFFPVRRSRQTNYKFVNLLHNHKQKLWLLPVDFCETTREFEIIPLLQQFLIASSRAFVLLISKPITEITSIHHRYAKRSRNSKLP